MKNVRDGYKMTEIGELPKEWEIKSMGEIFDFSGGLSISRANLKDKGVNYLHYGDIHMRNENYIDTEKDEAWLPKIEDKFEEIKDSVKLHSGDVVFADASEDYEGIGKSVAIFNDFEKPFVAGLHTIVAKDINNKLDKGYKRYCFSTNEVRKQFRYLTVGTSVYGISRENIKKIKVNIPTLKEQEKIASILSTVDEQIYNIDTLIGKNKELKKGLMQTLLTKGIGHTKFKNTEIGEVPNEWDIIKLSNCATIIDSLHETPQYSEDGFPMIRVIDVNGKAINTKATNKVCETIYKKFTRKYEPKQGDIIMSRVGSYGLVSYLKDSERVCLGQNIVIITTELCKKYLFYVLSSEYVKNNIEKVTVGSSQKTLSLANINELKILIPSVKEQNKISLILSDIDEKIEEYKNKKQKLEELKKGLMQQLLTGKIRTI